MAIKRGNYNNTEYALDTATSKVWQMSGRGRVAEITDATLKTNITNAINNPSESFPSSLKLSSADGNTIYSVTVNSRGDGLDVAVV